MTEVGLFDYELPEALVAAVPAPRRDESRLMGLDRHSGRIEHRRFLDLPDLLREDDLLVMNDARVVPARLQASRQSGGAVDILLVRPEETNRWLAMVRGGRLKEGETVAEVGTGAGITLLEKKGEGYWAVTVGDGDTEDLMRRTGAMPLPPYVLRSRRKKGLPERMPELDGERYQTVFAREPGAVAAPTAGLHFTDDLLERIRQKGVEVRMLTLLVGPGTFRPVRTDRVEDHRLEAEFFCLPAGTAAAVAGALRQRRRIVATGTTTCRVLEHVVQDGRWEERSGWTELFIYPPFEFRAVGALITNFHLPRSSLLMLVAALAGRGNVLNAYRVAVQERYRFYSYGDATFIA